MKLIIVLLLALVLSSCSIFQGTEKDEDTNNGKVEEVYVFDEVSDTKDNSEEVSSLKNEVDSTLTELEKGTENGQQSTESKANNDNYEGDVFYLQLGAFTTLKRAEQFKTENDSKVPFKLSIIFNTNNSLYTVRSSPFATKEEVKEIKDGFWKQNLFLDAFIVTE